MGSSEPTFLRGDCPEDGEIRTFLADRLDDPDRAKYLEEHISDCPDCRDRIERICAPILDGVRAHLGDTGKLSPAGESEALAEAIRRLVGGVPGDESKREGAPTPLAAISDFLGYPSNEAASLGTYELIEVLAEGGMGIVLRAHDRNLEREVAIKILDPVLAADPKARELFLREARAAAAIEHENVLPIYFVENGDSLPWFVMPLARGGTLAERLERREEGLVGDFDRVIDLSLQLARGLAAAHARGLIHRDIKPANVMLDETGTSAWLADFGLAAALENPEDSKPIGGTPGFMAPEVVGGDPADERSDLFSLGCVFFAMAFGRPAFSGDTVEALLESVASEDREDSSPRGDGVPRWYGELVAELLAKSPADRPDSADDVARLLDARRDERRSKAWRAKLWRRCLRSSALIAGVAGLAAAGLWVAAASGFSRGVNRVLANIAEAPFSVAGRYGVHRSLGDALRVAGDGAVIEIFGNDTWETSPVRIRGKDLILRGAPGDAPVLVSTSQDSPMLRSDSNLTIENLELKTELPPRKGMPSLVHFTGKSLVLERCRLRSTRRPGTREVGLLVGTRGCRRLDLQDTEIQTRDSFAIGFRTPPASGPSTARFENVVFMGPLLFMLFDERTRADLDRYAKPEVRIEMQACSVLSGTLFHIASQGASYPLTIEISRSAVDCSKGLLTTLATRDDGLRRHLRWINRENVYAVGSEMVFGLGRGTLGNPIRRIESPHQDWNDVVEWWGLEQGGSRRLDRIFTGDARSGFARDGTLGSGGLAVARDLPELSVEIGAAADTVGPRAARR